MKLKEEYLRNNKKMVISQWLREQCSKQFPLDLRTAANIDKLDTIVKEHHYQNKVELIREKIREALKLEK